MYDVFVISADSALASAATAYFERARGATIHVWNHEVVDFDSPESIHREESIADWIESRIRASGGDDCLRRAIALVDIHAKELYYDVVPGAAANAISRQDRYDRSKIDVVYELVLSFPEIQWILLTSGAMASANSWGRLNAAGEIVRSGSKRDLQGLGRIVEVHRLGLSPMYDPTGLREWIKPKLISRCSGVPPENVDAPVRPHMAIALDDEPKYAHLIGYAAYRKGFRALTVTSHGLFEKMCTGGKSLTRSERPFELTFEDLYLGFFDVTGTERASDLRNRDSGHRALEDAPYRIFLTSGPKPIAGSGERWEQNREYIEDLKERGIHARLLLKPITGILRLWIDAGLQKRFPGPISRSNGVDDAEAYQSETPAPHSAPGRLNAIATRLIARSRRLERNGVSVLDSIHGALLALEAGEYLQSRTPTTSLEALALKHRHEVRAECLFEGVGFDLDVEQRLKEIHAEVHAIARWFGSRGRRVASLAAEIGIMRDLVLLFRERSLFDQEQQCLDRLRSLQRDLWAARHPSWAWTLLAPRIYIDWLLGSMPRFYAAILLWTIALSTAFFFQGIRTGVVKGWQDVLVGGLGPAITAFFGIQPGYDETVLKAHPTLLALSLLAMVLGLVHIGIFISHLYTSISRR